MNDENVKTLTQLANELGVSRDKIIYRYKKLPKEFYYKENNTIFIKPEGVEQIIEELGDDIGELSTEEETETPSINQYLITQLTKKDEQIEQLQKLIDQQQQLNAEDKKLIKELHQFFALEAPKETFKESLEVTDEDSEEKKAKPGDTESFNEQFIKLESRIKKAEELTAEKATLEQELLALKNRKWYQFWK